MFISTLNIINTFISIGLRKEDPIQNQMIICSFHFTRQRQLGKDTTEVSNNFRSLAVDYELYETENRLKRQMYSLRHSALNQGRKWCFYGVCCR